MSFMPQIFVMADTQTLEVPRGLAILMLDLDLIWNTLFVVSGGLNLLNCPRHRNRHNTIQGLHSQLRLDPRGISPWPLPGAVATLL